jgi:hypothetical protein
MGLFFNYYKNSNSLRKLLRNLDIEIKLGDENVMTDTRFDKNKLRDIEPLSPVQKNNSLYLFWNQSKELDSLDSLGDAVTISFFLLTTVYTGMNFNFSNKCFCSRVGKFRHRLFENT